MKIERKFLTEEKAKEICTWHYQGKCSVYDYPSWEEIVKNNWAIAVKEERDKYFLGFVDEEDNLIAVVQLKEQENEVRFGISIKPELCGQGLGKIITTMAMEESKTRYPDKKLVLQVRTWNIRAIKCYQSQGFSIIGIKETKSKAEDKFYIMEYKR